MALHTSLRIHTAAENLLEAVIEGTFNMRRDAKPILGKQLVEECLEITSLIQDANTSQDKVPHLNLLLRKKSRVEVLLKAAMNKAKFSTGHYARASGFAVEVGRQAIGWRADSQRRQLQRPQGGTASA